MIEQILKYKVYLMLLLVFFLIVFGAYILGNNIGENSNSEMVQGGAQNTTVETAVPAKKNDNTEAVKNTEVEKKIEKLEEKNNEQMEKISNEDEAGKVVNGTVQLGMPTFDSNREMRKHAKINN